MLCARSFAAICFLATLAFFHARSAHAQYLYLDTNGDGVSSGADRLNANGTPTTVDAWINTNHNRNGSSAACNRLDGNLGFWNSYAVNIVASGGTVAFSAFTNRLANFNLTCVGVGVDFLSNSTEMTACRATATSEAGGLKKMFTVTVTGQTGAPGLQYLALGNLSPNYTSFGTPCSGNDFDNTYKLGSDFFDHDGAGPFGSSGRPPRIDAPANANGQTLSSFTVTASASDPDAGDTVTLSQTNNTPFLSGPTSAGPVTNPSLTLSGTPNLTQGGNYTISWTASDNHVTPNTSTATTNVWIATTPHSPIVTAPATVSGNENSLITFTVTVSDPDGDAISEFWASGTALFLGASFTKNPTNTGGTFAWTPTFTQAGSWSVAFAAANALSSTAFTTITVLNDPSGGNFAPVVTAPAAVTAWENNPVTFTVSTVDPEADPIAAFTAASSPATTGSAFTTNTGNTSGTFSWTPSFTQAGTYGVTFTASNASSGVAFTQIVVRENVTSLAIQTLPSVTGMENTAIEFTVVASDPDGDPIAVLSASGSAISAGGKFTVGAGNVSGTFQWTPSTAQAGIYSLILTASNTLPLTSQNTVTGGTVVTVLSSENGANLVGNPSFESSTTGWSGLDGGTIARVAGGYDGAWALEVRGPSTGIGKFSVNDSPNWVASSPGVGAIYRFKAWVRSDAGTGLARLRIREYTNRALRATTYSSNLRLGPAWQLLVVDCVTYGVGSTLDFQIMDTPGVAAEVFQTDAVSIVLRSSGIPAIAAQPDLQARMSPNPLNPDATLAFTTNRNGPIRVRIFGPTGRLVRTLLDERDLPASRHAVRFDGKDGSGQRLASGVYFYRIEGSGAPETGRFAIVK